MPRYPPYSGNRLAVPPRVRSRHFFYKTKPLTIARAQLEVLADIAAPVLRRRVRADHIDVIGHQLLIDQCGQLCRSTWDTLIDAFPAFVRESADEFEMLACEWTNLHVDPLAGIALYSVVVRTGPFPYRMQTVHTRRRIVEGEELSEVVTSTRILEVGDAFVFDPTSPHQVLPERPHADQLLILLQAQLPDSDDDDRAAIVTNIGPAPGDRNYASGPL